MVSTWGGVARLNSDGYLETSFDSGTVADDTIEAVAIQPDGKIIVKLLKIKDFTFVNKNKNKFKIKKIQLFLVGLFFVFLFLSGNALAVDETTVENIIPNEFQGGGTAQGWNGDDDEWGYTLPFTFNFYGTDYTDIKIGSNGIICLDNTKDCTWYYPLSDDSTGPVISPLGIDLQTDADPANNDIYITENSNNVVIRWDVAEYDETDQINFEAILYSDGNIKFNYGDQDALNLSDTAIVGITNGDGINYTSSIYDGNDNFNQLDTSAWGEFNPQSESFSPTDNSSNAELDTDLSITFDRNIYQESGNITIKETSDDSTVETIDVNSSQLTGWGTDTLIINPTNNLDYYTGYYIEIDSTAIKNIDDNNYDGISDKTTWNFTTKALTEVIKTIPSCQCYTLGTAKLHNRPTPL